MARVHDELPDRRKVQRGQLPSSSDSSLSREESLTVMEALQRSAGNSAVGQLLGGQRASATPSDGKPVPPAIRLPAERKLAADLDDVRLHDDAEAAALTSSLRAEAVTMGKDVYLGPHVMNLDSSAGQQTLLHELVHAVQAQPQGGPARGVSDPGSRPEAEAHAIETRGLRGEPAPPTQQTPAGIAHRKQESTDQGGKPSTLAEQLLNPESADKTDAEPAPGASGAAESVVFEITIMQPMRAAFAAVEQQDWEAALDQLQSIGMRLMDYQSAYEKRDPVLGQQLMGARGWLSVVYQQLNRRLDRGLWSDDKIVDAFTDTLGEFERLESLLH